MTSILALDREDLKQLLLAAIREIRDTILTDLLNTIEENMLDMDIARGQLFQDILPDYDEGIIYINAPHAGYVEFGTVGQVYVDPDPYAGDPDLAGPVKSMGRKGPPPELPIRNWARLKLGSEEFVEAIRWKIYWFGSKPKPAIRNAIDFIQHKYNNITLTIEVTA